MRLPPLIPKARRSTAARPTNFAYRPNVPVKDFWSFTLYDNQTRSMLQTDQRFPSVNSTVKGIVTNADGSVDVWFGPTLPEGVSATNWAQTVPGKGWNALFRLYGPLQPWFDK